MASENSQPPMAWRYCGNQLKLWRTQAGVTREELGKEAGYEYETVKSMEQGRRRPATRLLEVADEMCGARGKLIAAREYLVPERFPSFSREYMEYEAEAVVIDWYEPLLIPGLLQTEETVRLLLNAHWPPLDDETIEERVAARLARQYLLEKQTRSFNFVIGEGVLRHPIGTVASHKQQLAHLLEVSGPRNTTVQVSPSGGAHPGLNGPFILMETPDHEHLAYEEGQATGMLHSSPEKVSLITQRHAVILRRAHSPEASARLIRELMEGL